MKALIGLGGIGAVQGVAQVPTDGTPTIEIGKLIIQLVIGIATLWKMFKKPKEDNSNQNK
jgi:hypothetical protein